MQVRHYKNEYSRVPLYPIKQNFADGIVVFETGPLFGGKTHIPYLALTGLLWGVNCENFRGNWPCYNGTGLYLVSL